VIVHRHNGGSSATRRPASGLARGEHPKSPRRDSAVASLPVEKLRRGAGGHHLAQGRVWIGVQWRQLVTGAAPTGG
jgi:hypothetical protein